MTTKEVSEFAARMAHERNLEIDDLVVELLQSLESVGVMAFHKESIGSQMRLAYMAGVLRGHLESKAAEETAHRIVERKTNA